MGQRARGRGVLGIYEPGWIWGPEGPPVLEGGLWQKGRAPGDGCRQPPY